MGRVRNNPSGSHWNRPEAGNDTLVIGIDFGTTYCGAAWATAADFDREKINFIINWPGTGREEGKAPTELYYDPENGEMSWGFDIPGDVEPVRWFKLLLLKDEDLVPEIRESEFLLRSRKALRKLGKSPVDVIADYLRALWSHIQETIIKSRGKSVVNALTFHVVLTVPAIWKEYARQDMEKAAKQAGILDRRFAGPTRLTFAPEPEAAALSTLFERGGESNAGDVYIICDAGGGTVDLITYAIESVEPIRMREAVEGTGGLCGGIFIDEAFQDLCQNRLGRRWEHLSPRCIKDIMKGEWERSIKPQFTPRISKRSTLSGSPQKHSVAKSHLQVAFTGVFSQILELIKAQKKKTIDQGLEVTGIILVGGLGGSPYLYQYLSDELARADISVLQSGGIGPRTAICHGAVFKGFLESGSSDATKTGQNQAAKLIQITSTISRASFGVSFSSTFRKGVHLEEDMFWNDDWAEYQARNQMEWYIKKGECVSNKNPVSHQYVRVFSKQWDGRYTETIYQCEDPEPPTRQTSSTIDGMKQKLSYSMEMIPTGATVDFAVICNGTRLGNTSLKVCS
ncbi:hypothetical protein B0J13DRAFT_639687 [Dactylonectria estremocensis]|uniref:Uncharacterized protein n=1 Tax=Dactylonectria estremocensis TaxID=1079267 RepID=A0A9P9EHQ7_9HYPO|nr:hypothetical protein B0J13DRAFT_639687 [Dactylonectria estremocensis]